ncbi:MAG: hypothetical protein CML61_06535 [Rhodobacteraceae bacterium]|jgi:hypothetical protein|nr:hypothetical protein [Paracoccaceae bacterium]|tara:strand:- start:867 stop:1121 length:255 start_codon:yes stop_codon:yes gene_type:complete
MRITLPALLTLGALATPAFADMTSGTILAYDRLANVIVLTDKTHWTLHPDALVPADLKAGDKITIDFVSDGDNGSLPVKKLERQ